MIRRDYNAAEWAWRWRLVWQCVLRRYNAGSRFPRQVSSLGCAIGRRGMFSYWVVDRCRRGKEQGQTPIHQNDVGVLWGNLGALQKTAMKGVLSQ